MFFIFAPPPPATSMLYLSMYKMPLWDLWGPASYIIQRESCPLVHCIIGRQTRVLAVDSEVTREPILALLD